MRTTALMALLTAAPAAAHIDWRDTGCIEKVVDNGHLVTPDVKPSVEAVQCVLARDAGVNVTLSTQQIMDCATDLGTFGSAFNYILHNGLETAAAYPPAADTNVDRPRCIYEKDLVAVRIQDIGGSAAGPATEKDLEAAVQKSPVAVAFEAGTELELYTGGILSKCGDDPTAIHVMEIVGYSDPDPDQNNTAYWIVKNNWGKDWGIDGYVYISKDTAACGLHQPTYLYPINASVVEGRRAKPIPMQYLRAME